MDLETLSKELTRRLDAFEGYLRSVPIELGREPALFVPFRKEFERRLADCEEVTHGLDRRITSKLQRLSWKHPGHPLFLEAPVNWRAFHKPRGYAGDGELLDMFHRAGYEGDTALGRLIHRVSMLQPAALAVRNRAQLVRAGMEEAMYRYGTECRILSMGCGTSPELTRLTADHPYYENPDWRWLGLDVDAETLVSARHQHLDPRVSFMEVNALALSRDPGTWRWGQFHFMYAVGLFDYFPLGIGQPLVRAMFDNLAPGGRMWVGNFHPHNKTRWYMEFIAKWHLIHRTEDELMTLVDPLPAGAYEVRIFEEPARAQIFMEILKT